MSLVLNPRKKYREEASNHSSWQGFLGYYDKSKVNKSKNSQVELDQIKKFLCSKEINRVKKQPTE